MAAAARRLFVGRQVLSASFKRARLCTAARAPREVLGVSADAPRSEVDQAFLRLALYHRARAGESEESARAYGEVCEALRHLASSDAATLPAALTDSDELSLPQPQGKSDDGLDPGAVPALVPQPSRFLLSRDPQLAPVQPYVPSVLRGFDQWMRKLPDHWDSLLGHTYPSLIHKLLREGALPEAFDCFAEMKQEGEKPTAAVYEMLIRGCALAMRRVTVEEGEGADTLTQHLYARVLGVWAEMREAKVRVDRFTYIELLRACGKAGQVDAAFAIFDKMLTLPQFLPDSRTFDSMYELCNALGEHEHAFEIFRDQQELSKSLHRPKLTPVTFSQLMRAAVEGGQMARIPPVLDAMEAIGQYPSRAACKAMLQAAVDQRALPAGARVLKLTAAAGHTPDRLVLDEYENALELARLEAAGEEAARRAGELPAAGRGAASQRAALPGPASAAAGGGRRPSAS